MERKEIRPGEQIGRWMVQEKFERTAKGERKWLCRCQCGTERYVLERSLKSGASLSCGCLRKEAARDAVAHDLTGMVFGDLTVTGREAQSGENRGIRWNCRCACGNTVQVLGTLLATGKKTHCGCKTVRSAPIADISGERFGRLTALYPTRGRDAKGSVLWQCRCDCGREILAPYNSLKYTSLQSCGCQKKEHDQALPGYLTHIDGTSMEMLASRKVPANNTTGTRGVYFVKGKYLAKIVFQKKAYYLGSYVRKSDAIRARQEAEETIFNAAWDFYAAWKRRAEEDPLWATQNPASVRVTRDRDDRLRLETTPDLRASRAEAGSLRRPGREQVAGSLPRQLLLTDGTTL